LRVNIARTAAPDAKQATPPRRLWGARGGGEDGVEGQAARRKFIASAADLPCGSPEACCEGKEEGKREGFETDVLTEFI